MVKNDFKKLVEQYKDYSILIEDADTLQFKKIDNVTNEILKKYRVDEIDHERKAIYLELKQSNKYILITTSDNLELPLCVAKNLNQAAEFMQVKATHVYRAWRREGRPNVLEYNNFKLIKIFL